jgi:molybdopterin synthase sulfur carrier subunit
MEPVTIKLPSVLAQVVGGERTFGVRGSSLGEALDDLVRQRPTLGVHLFDEAGQMRRHILCFCNDSYTRGASALAMPVSSGDTITILNSVSGG